jgi:thymidylate synthase
MKSIYIIGDNLPEVWEKAVLTCWNEGTEFETQYDKENDSPSKDVTAMLHVKYPLSEPRIHRAFPGGLKDLEKYRSEILYGVHDSWIAPQEGKWQYTYHQRLFEYSLPYPKIKVHHGDVELGCLPHPINQIQKCIEMLKGCGFTRRAQAITWKVWEDLNIHDPACLQRMFFRVESQNNQNPKLNMNVHMRSNDAYKAAFMNMYAFIELQKYVAEQVGVEVGEYIHIADSFHIYGSYFNEFEGFLKMTQKREFKERVWSNNFGIPMFIEACEELLAEENMPDKPKNDILERKKYLLSL